MIGSLVRSLKKRRISKYEKEDVDVEEQERERNPFGHLVEKSSFSSSLKHIITPKKRKTNKNNSKTPSLYRTPGPSMNHYPPATPTTSNSTIISTPFTDYDRKLVGWRDLECTPVHTGTYQFQSTNVTMSGKENSTAPLSPTTISNKKTVVSMTKSVQKVPTPMTDDSDKLDTYHSPLTSPLQIILQSSPCLRQNNSPQVKTVSRATRGHNLNVKQNSPMSPKTAPAKASMRHRRLASFIISPRRSPMPKKLIFDDVISSSPKNNRNEDGELVTEEDEYELMSNEEKIANVFQMVRSPFERILNAASPSSRKRSAVDRSTTTAPPAQYPYCLRIFIGAAKNLIDTQVGFKRNPDPYVTLEVGQCRQNTVHVTGTRDPVFNQSFSFIVHSTRRPAVLAMDTKKNMNGSPMVFDSDDNSSNECMEHKDADLIIKVFDHDNIFSHAFMGRCVISLTELLQQCQYSPQGRSEVKTAEVNLIGDGIEQGTLQIVYDMSQGCNFKF